MTKSVKETVKADGFVVMGALPLSGSMTSVIPVEAVREPAGYVKKLTVNHARQFEEGDELSGALTFFMSKDGQNLETALKIIEGLGHRPAMIPETEFLRHNRASKAKVFDLALQHAERRKLNPRQVSGISEVFLPVLGTSLTIASTSLTPALILNRYVGGDGYELLRIKDVHPGWLIPIVQAT